MLSPLPISPLQAPYPIPFQPASMSLFPSIPLHCGINWSQDQGPPLLLMPAKSILCYICSWRHGFLHVYFLGGSLVPGSSVGVCVWLVDTVVLSMGLQTPSAPSVLPLTLPLLYPCSVQWLAVSSPSVLVRLASLFWHTGIAARVWNLLGNLPWPRLTSSIQF